MQPNFIIFLPQLLELFQVCKNCKMPGVLIEVKKFGTMVQVETTWRSQPTMPGTFIPAGNLLLSFSILCGGGSASKVLRIIEHMGPASISLSTFFRHQCVCI